MKAKKARILSYANNLALKTELEHIYQLIEEKCKDGETELYLLTNTADSIIDHLNFDLGYSVETKEDKKSGELKSLKITW